MMASMHLYLYWKHGVELRPIEDVVPKYFSVDLIIADGVDARQHHTVSLWLKNWRGLTNLPCRVRACRLATAWC